MLRTLLPLATLAVACAPSQLDVTAEDPAFAHGDDIGAFQAIAQPVDTTKARGGADLESETKPVDTDPDEGCELYYGFFVGTYGGGAWEGEFTDLSNNWLADAEGAYYDTLGWDGTIKSGDLGGSASGDWGTKVFKGDIDFDGVTDAVVSGGYEAGEFAGLWTACI